MKLILSLCLVLFLIGCQSTSKVIEPFYSSDIVEIKEEQLWNYWVPRSTKVKMLRKRPNWLPKGEGKWTVLTVIDSNGHVVEKTLVSSIAEGFMTQKKVDQMPLLQFKPSASNKNKTPVKYYSQAVIAPRHKLKN